MSIEAMKQALEFVASISPAFICEATHHTKKERHDAFKPCPHVERHNRVFESLRQAIEQAEKQEPVAMVGSGHQLLWTGVATYADHARQHGIKVGSLLYTDPTPQRECEGCDKMAKP